MGTAGITSAPLCPQWDGLGGCSDTPVRGSPHVSSGRVGPLAYWNAGAPPRPSAVPLVPLAVPLAICVPSQGLLIPGWDRGQLTRLLFP